MSIDWHIPIGTLVVVGLQLVLTVVGTLRALQRIEKSIDARFAHFELSLNTFKEGDIRELRTSVQRLETGQDEWTKALRARTHEHANEINLLKLKVDRLERPGHYPARSDERES